jgi:acetyl esterase
LVLASALKIKDTDGLDPRIVGFNLIYGVYDLSQTPSTRLVNDDALILSKHNLTQFYNNSVYRLNPKDLQNPELSPLYANLTRMPPALFSVGSAGALIDDSSFMTARWQTAGNKAILDIYPECTHGFDSAPTKIAQLARQRMNN